MKKILILGASGMLGHMLCRQLGHEGYKIHGTTRKAKKELIDILPHSVSLHEKIDVLDFDFLRNFIERLKPDIIINCVGVIKQSSLVDDTANLYELNSILPQKLAYLCASHKIHMIHFSTDCVFDGLKGKAYTENDIPTAQDNYGKSKLLGEVSNTYSLTIRTSIVGHELSRHKSLFDWVFSQKRKNIKGFTKALYTGVTTLEMANFIAYLLKKDAPLTGLYHFSADEISKHDLIVKMNSLFDLKLTIEPDSFFYCDRRLNSDKIFQIVDYPRPTWDKMLLDFTKDHKNYI